MVAALFVLVIVSVQKNLGLVEKSIKFLPELCIYCYVFLNEPVSNRLSNEQRKQFLSHMTKRHEDWQLKIHIQISVAGRRKAGGGLIQVLTIRKETFNFLMKIFSFLP